MKRAPRRSIQGLLLIVAMCVAAYASGQHAQPNILLILVDDLGKEWVGCYGAEEIETPHIDRLAESGIQFQNAWCMPQCTPTRVTLLTGQYPFRHGWTNHWDVPRWGAGCHFDPRLNTSFANVLRAAGYKTCAAGKWQIDDFRVEPQALDAAGFDDWCMWTGYETGNRPSANRYWDPYIHTRTQGSRKYAEQFGPDMFTDHLIRFMNEHKQHPLLLYYPMVLTHGPLTTTPDSRGKLDKRSLFQGMVRYTDKLVGKLVAALDTAGLRDNTVIVFTTDNGTGGMTNRRLGREVGGGKMKMDEQNGVAQPFIVSCPGRVPAGVESDALIDFTDILPTFAEIAGASLPEDRPVDGVSFADILLGKTQQSQRQWIMSMGGAFAVLRDGRVHPRLAFDDRVIRNQQYKLWIDTNRQPTRLFDLLDDPWEQHNLIDSSNPDIIAAKNELMQVIDSLPDKDASPAYEPNPPQPWDKPAKRR